MSTPSSTAPPFALYNPALLPPEVLLAEFTARLPLLARLLDIIRANAPAQPPQHVLLLGPRGMGKTTMLWAIAGSIGLREPELRQQWQPVVFDEESRRIGDLTDFWIECIQQWEAATEPHLTRSVRVDALLDKPGPDLEDRAREAFLRLVDASGKRALLLIDNLNDILGVLHDEEPLLRLRSFLMSDSRVMIIGTATRWFTDVTSLDKPFFEFFRPFDLGPLNLVEMRECLAGIAKARGDQNVLDALEKRAGSIEALHLLTGGNPRLIRTFYRLLNEGMNGEMRQQLERLLDDYTPYHKAIIDSLPSQQQRVFDAVALHWNPCDVASVARTTRLPSNQVSAQIKALSKAGLVSEVPAAGTSKKKAYLLTDRFSNIHYLMRHGRAGRVKMHWYIMTLRALFDDGSFADAAAKAVRELSRAGGIDADEGMVMARSALICAESELARRMFLDQVTGSLEYDEDLDVAERVCLQAIKDHPKDAYVHFKWGRLLHVHLDRPTEAEAAYRQAIALDPKGPRPLCHLGWFLSQYIGRKDEAEAAYRQAIALNPKYAAALNGLGSLLTDDAERKDEAEAAYQQAIAQNPKYAQPWHNLGVLLSKDIARKAEAEAAYRQAIALDPKYASPWNGLGVLLSEDTARNAEAEAAYRQAIVLNSQTFWPWNNLGLLLSNDSVRTAEAEAAYRQAITLEAKDARVWFNLGHLLSRDPARKADAEDAYRQALDLDAMDAETWHNLSNLLRKDSTRLDEAEAGYRHAIALDPNAAYPRSSLSELLALMGRENDECRELAAHGLLLQPDNIFGRYEFQAVCFNDGPSLGFALPPLSTWCGEHSEATDVFAFAVDAWVAFAKVATVAEALALLNSLPETAQMPFDLLRDAFIAHADKDHLQRLAPERRTPVLKLLERIGNDKPQRKKK